MSRTIIEKYIDEKSEKYLGPIIKIFYNLSFMPNMSNEDKKIGEPLNKSYHNYILHAIWNIKALPLWAKRLYVVTCFVTFPLQIALTIIDIIFGVMMTGFNFIGGICFGCLMLVVVCVNALYKIWTNYDEQEEQRKEILAELQKH